MNKQCCFNCKNSHFDGNTETSYCKKEWWKPSVVLSDDDLINYWCKDGILDDSSPDPFE